MKERTEKHTFKEILRDIFEFVPNGAIVFTYHGSEDSGSTSTKLIVFGEGANPDFMAGIDQAEKVDDIPVSGYFADGTVVSLPEVGKPDSRVSGAAYKLSAILDGTICYLDDDKKAAMILKYQDMLVKQYDWDEDPFTSNFESYVWSYCVNELGLPTNNNNEGSLLHIVFYRGDIMYIGGYGTYVSNYYGEDDDEYYENAVKIAKKDGQPPPERNYGVSHGDHTYLPSGVYFDVEDRGSTTVDDMLSDDDGDDDAGNTE